MQIQNTLSRSVLQRCRELEDIIKTTSTKELRHALPYVIENMFGFGSEIGWGIDKIDKYHNPQEFECVRRFLSPDGPLLSLIYKLQADVYLSYEFPFKCLPAPTRQVIEDGMVPLFLVNKIQSQAFGQTFLSLSAFEYFMFHLAYCLVNPSNVQTCPSWTNLYDYLYPNIVDDYISYFLPLDKKTLPAMPNLPSPVRSPMANYTVPSTSYGSHSPTSPSTTPPRHRNRPSLFKPAFTVLQKQHVQGSPVLDQSEAETWRSETLLQVFTEFWLNQNPLETDKSIFSQASYHPRIRLVKFSPTYERDPFAYLFVSCLLLGDGNMMENIIPSLNQVKMVRLLVKYLHFFANSASNVVTSPFQTIMHSPLDEFKRSVVPQVIQKKLYTFLRHAFDRWPLDSSFRMVLETWLSYIQPWRYIDPNQYYLSKTTQRPDPYELKDRRVDDKWEQFVEDNLLFYSILFQQFLPRVFRLDLSSPQSAYMLYRVTKVFCLQNLAGLICKAESWSNRSHRHHMSMDIGASYLSHDLLSQLLPPLPPHLADLEAPGYMYTPMFSEHMNAQIQDLMQRIILARENVINQQAIAKQKSQGFGAWLVSIFTDPYLNTEMNDNRKLQLHLSQALQNLTEIFGFSLPEDLQHMTLMHDNSSDNSMLGEPSSPDCIQTNHGPVLTDLGRYQVANKMRKFDMMYQGDPDLQPIRSFENATLVRILHQFCAFVNSQFSRTINNMYCRQDLIGRMTQVYFSPPIKPNTDIKSPMSKSVVDSLRQPRLSLRFLASYQTLIYLGILYIFLRLWLNMGPVSFIFLLLALCLVYGFLRAVFFPKSVIER